MNDSENSLLGRDEMIEVARELAAEIHRRRLFAKDGSTAWLGPWNPPPDQPVKLSPVGPHLYGGTLGIALFLAALDHVDGTGEHRELCLEALGPLRQRLTGLAADPERAQAAKMGIGGMVGLGGFAYSLWKVGGWLRDPTLLVEARALLALFSPERIEAASSSDVISGLAGAILVLLALTSPEAEVEPEPAIATAELCARQLAARLHEAEGRPAGWTTLPGFPPLSGFGHGAGGIAHALLRLYARTGRSEHQELALKGLAFERTLYSPAHRNWRDARRPGDQFMTSWCHGAPGIALGRIGTLDVLDTPEIRADVQNALATTLDEGLVPLDHVCCGNMGRVEILLAASRKLDDESLYEEARKLATAVVRRGQEQGGYRWVLEPGSAAFDPSFFTGASGVGYTLLRLAGPGLVPNILSLE
ncbi:MAG TPA: type 2 lanthipeptide synthetase LanM [Thermoanaerobaculia bacterium]|jgi:type 2 lantibiotic biosynthesis protein LanM|nr:type 2 lanthipeptide synthetase LanM [Thermoanaerobaculia bacterium]